MPVIAAWMFLAHYRWTPEFNLYVAIFAAAATIIGIPVATAVSIESGLKDPSLVVIDEVAGQAIALIGAPVFGWKYALAAFILFRAFDILKPPPIRQLESLPRGWGIMMDDVGAGALACLLLQIAFHMHLFS